MKLLVIFYTIVQVFNLFCNTEEGAKIVIACHKIFMNLFIFNILAVKLLRFKMK